MCEIEFPDGSTDIVTANLIAENLFSQIDEEGYQHQILKEITDCRFRDDAIKPEDGFVQTYSGQQGPKITTKGCEMQVTLTDCSSTWIPLKDIKVSNLLIVTEYAVTHKLGNQPCFNWWMCKTLKTRDMIIKNVKSGCWKKTNKCGIELPHSVEAALAIDKKIGTTFWADALGKEMKNVIVAFDFPEDGTVPPGFKMIKCHMVFDIKSSLVRKARFVAGGDLTH